MSRWVRNSARHTLEVHATAPSQNYVFGPSLERPVILDLASFCISGENFNLIPNSSLVGALVFISGPVFYFSWIPFSGFDRAAASTAASWLIDTSGVGLFTTTKKHRRQSNQILQLDEDTIEKKQNHGIWTSPVVRSRWHRNGLSHLHSPDAKDSSTDSDLTSHFASRLRDGLSHASTTHLGPSDLIWLLYREYSRILGMLLDNGFLAIPE